MRTLIVPCAGSRLLSGIPLFLQRHPDGSLLAEKAIKGIYPEKFDRVVFTVLSDIDKTFGVNKVITEELSKKYPVEVILLPKKTEGPAETVYRTLTLGNVSGEIVIRDSHNFIKIENDMSGNFIAGLDLTQYEKSIEGLRSKSFLILNEQKQVLDVIEKRFCSDVISVGLYGFKKSDDFKMAYEHLSDPNYPIEKLYISHIISYLIGYKQRVFHSVSADIFEDWGTQAVWNRVQKKYSTCFLDLDKVFGKKIPDDQKIINELRNASEEGCRFIIYSSYNVEEKLEKNLKEKGVNVIGAVSNCTFSNSRMIIDNLASLHSLLLEV